MYLSKVTNESLCISLCLFVSVSFSPLLPSHEHPYALDHTNSKTCVFTHCIGQDLALRAAWYCSSAEPLLIAELEVNSLLEQAWGNLQYINTFQWWSRCWQGRHHRKESLHRFLFFSYFLLKKWESNNKIMERKTAGNGKMGEVYHLAFEPGIHTNADHNSFFN